MDLERVKEAQKERLIVPKEAYSILPKPDTEVATSVHIKHQVSSELPE